MSGKIDMKRLTSVMVVFLSLSPLLWAQQIKVLYENDFEKAEPGKVPADFLVLDGGFAVREEQGNKFFELPGAPLETFGVLFGPAEKAGLAAAARVYGTSKGRRSPAFGIGLGGVAGHRLLLNPGKRTLELYRGDSLKTSMPLEWETGKWIILKLQIRRAGEGVWKVEGKIWRFGDAEPAEWRISLVEREEPPSGRASLWGSPYSGTPICYDDLRVTSALDKP